jgi:hypothetical protein
MPKRHIQRFRTVAAAHRGSACMMRRMVRRLLDEQGYRDLCAAAAPLRCRR